MIKRIAHLADVHIKNYQRLEEFEKATNKLYGQLNRDFNNTGELINYDERLIIIAGDLVDQKNTISNELMAFVSNFLRELTTLAPVLVISGNHDLVVDNNSRMDTLTGIFETAKIDNCYFLDQISNYKSAIFSVDNLQFKLFSIWYNHTEPSVTDVNRLYVFDSNKHRFERSKSPQKTTWSFGLFHGPIVGSQLANGSKIESGLDTSIFSSCDAVIAGDIHKRQDITYKYGENAGEYGLLVYPGSLIQKDRGESVSGHGYVLWVSNEDGSEYTHTYVDIDTDYGMYNMKITCAEDIDNDKEIIINE